MLRTIALSKTITAVCNAAGVATASIGPVRYGDKWTVTSVAVQNTSTVLVPAAVLSIAGVVQGATYTGTQDSTGVSADLLQGQLVSVTWTGGDAGSTCTLSVYGTRTIEGG